MTKLAPAEPRPEHGGGPNMLGNKAHMKGGESAISGPGGVELMGENTIHRSNKKKKKGRKE